MSSDKKKYQKPGKKADRWSNYIGDSEAEIKSHRKAAEVVPKTKGGKSDKKGKK